jgi:hypothetical protein
MLRWVVATLGLIDATTLWLSDWLKGPFTVVVDAACEVA